MFEEIEHTADLAIRVAAPTFSGLLAEAARAVMALSAIEVEEISPKQESITLNAGDPETLLVSWLEELLYTIEVNHQAYQDCQIEVSGEYQLQATVSLVPVKRLQRHIKAVTYPDLSVEIVEQGFETVIVFDV